MDLLSSDQLAELERLLERAPDEWTARGSTVWVRTEAFDGPILGGSLYVEGPQGSHNASLIAAMKRHLPALLAASRLLEGRRGNLATLAAMPERIRRQMSATRGYLIDNKIDPRFADTLLSHYSDLAREIEAAVSPPTQEDADR